MEQLDDHENKTKNVEILEHNKEFSEVTVRVDGKEYKNTSKMTDISYGENRKGVVVTSIARAILPVK